MVEIEVCEGQALALLSEFPDNMFGRVLSAVFDAAAGADVCIDMISAVPRVSDSAGFAFSFAEERMAALLSSLSAHGGVLKNGVKLAVSAGYVKFLIKAEKMASDCGFASRVAAALNALGGKPEIITTGVTEISVLLSELCRAEFESLLKKEFENPAQAPSFTALR